MENTARELEIQKLACEVLNEMTPVAEKYIDQMKTSMEACYYLKQITTRLEIILALKHGLVDGTSNATL